MRVSLGLPKMTLQEVLEEWITGHPILSQHYEIREYHATGAFWFAQITCKCTGVGNFIINDKDVIREDLRVFGEEVSLSSADPDFFANLERDLRTDHNTQINKEPERYQNLINYRCRTQL